MIKRFIKYLFGKQPIKTIAEDPFIKRLRSTVIGEGMLHEGNIYLMDYAIRHMPEGGNAVEIGSYGGLSTNLLIYLLQKHNRDQKLLTCDPWVYEGFKDSVEGKQQTIDGRDDISRSAYMKYIKESFVKATRFLSEENLPYTFEMTSDKFFEKYHRQEEVTDVFGRTIQLSGPISFAYIDGNHAYAYVKRDFENVSNLLKKDGLILFDDSWDSAQFGSAQLMDEVKANREFELVEKNPNYLFRKL